MPLGLGVQIHHQKTLSLCEQLHAAWAQVTWSGSWLAMSCVDPGAGAASGVQSAERDASSL